MPEVMLYKATGPTDAYLLRRALADHGIACRLDGEALMGLAGGIPIPDAFPRVWVDREDAPAAEEVLRAWRGPALVHPAWRCPSCGEENPAGFEICWSCEGGHPDGEAS